MATVHNVTLDEPQAYNEATLTSRQERTDNDAGYLARRQ